MYIHNVKLQFSVYILFLPLLFLPIRSFIRTYFHCTMMYEKIDWTMITAKDDLTSIKLFVISTANNTSCFISKRGFIYVIDDPLWRYIITFLRRTRINLCLTKYKSLRKYIIYARIHSYTEIHSNGPSLYTLWMLRCT